MTNLREAKRRFGLHAKSGRGDCPACGYQGSFQAAERAGRVIGWCASCQDREAIARALAGGTRHVPGAPLDKSAEKADRERKQAFAMALWNGSEKAGGTIVAAYLQSRGLPAEMALSPALRFRRDCNHPEGGRLPAMIALVADATGKPTAIHRTYLRADGSGKADVQTQRATLGPFFTGAVRLQAAGAEIVIGEGIETSLAAGLLLGLPAWAALAAGNLQYALILPPEVRRVVIAVDRDPAGERAARAAWRRWTAEGRAVRLMVPNALGTDAADILGARKVTHG